MSSRISSMRHNGKQMLRSGEEPEGMKRKVTTTGPVIAKFLLMKPAVLEIKLRSITDKEWLKELNWRAVSARKKTLSDIIVERIKSLP